MSWDTLVAVVAIGAMVGFTGGLFGKGGSAVATPLLVLVGIPPIVALASPLPATVPSTAVASYAYWQERFLDWKVVLWSVAFGVPAVALGAYATRWVGGDDLVVLTEALIVGLGARFVLRPGSPHERTVDVRAPRARMVLIAVVAGLAVGLARQRRRLPARAAVPRDPPPADQAGLRVVARSGVRARGAGHDRARRARAHRLGGRRRLRCRVDPALVSRRACRLAHARGPARARLRRRAGRARRVRCSRRRSESRLRLLLRGALSCRFARRCRGRWLRRRPRLRRATPRWPMPCGRRGG